MTEEKEKPKFVNAQIPRELHSEVRKIAFDEHKDARDLYAEIIPLGLKVWREHQAKEIIERKAS